MREIGIVTLLSVAVTAAAPGPRDDRPATFQTPKSTEDFATCFARAQDRSGTAWWFVPRENGGTFSNLGNRKGAAAYFVVINDRGPHRDVALDEHAQAAGLREVVNQCI